jgi:hypothetical protein
MSDQTKVRDGEGALANTRGACAPRSKRSAEALAKEDPRLKSISPGYRIRVHSCLPRHNLVKEGLLMVKEI